MCSSKRTDNHSDHIRAFKGGHGGYRHSVSGVYKITQLLPSKAMIVNIASRAPMSRMSGPSRKANSSAICDPVAALSFRPAREAR
jgi:hypothetical protein